MGLNKKLQQWQDAGLLNADQAARIAEFEQERKGGRFGRGLAGAALIAILCGVLSIIGANWMLIPASAKIGSHVALNLLIAFVLWHVQTPRIREGLCLVLFGLTLTLIVLIGQVFQFGGAWTGALVFWMVITAPLIAFYGQTRVTGWPWMGALLVTIVTAMYEHLSDVPEFWGSIFIVATALILPLAFIADGNIKIIQRHKPAYADIFIRTGFILLLLAASGASVAWYESRYPLFDSMAASIEQSPFNAQMSLILVFVIGGLLQAGYAAYKKFYAGIVEHKAGAQIAALCTLFMALPIIFTKKTEFTMVSPGVFAPLPDLSLWTAPLSSLHFILLWMGVGYLAQTQGWHRLVSLAILLITIRVFVIYCELFGDLMTTGLGLISGGLIMLGLLWGARRLSKHLKTKAAA